MVFEEGRLSADDEVGGGSSSCHPQVCLKAEMLLAPVQDLTKQIFFPNTTSNFSLGFPSANI